jgi:hypothetical protein
LFFAFPSRALLPSLRFFCGLYSYVVLVVHRPHTVVGNLLMCASMSESGETQENG